MALRAGSAMLEREGDLVELETALDEARGGSGGLIVIEGPPGIGKTRLLRETRERAAVADMRVLKARGSELERDFPFALVRQLFEPVLMATEAREREQVLGGAAQRAGRVVGFEEASGDGRSSSDPSFATLNALYWLTSNLAEAHPMLMAVDDVHWSDEPSLRFFGFLASRLDDLPVVVALAARPAEPGAASELLAQLVVGAAGRVVRPRALSAGGVGDLVRQWLASDADDAFCAACHDASGGNPFMLRELLTELAAEGSSGTAAEAAQVRDVAPRTIKRSVLLRLARLPEAASRLAHAVAVLGDDVQLRDAADLAESERGAAAEAADALAGAGILEPGRPLRFVHPLLRSAAYADLPAATTAALHQRAAGLLKDRGAEPERVAVHLLATDSDADPAVVETLSAAARRALDRAAPEAAIAYLRRALDEPPLPSERLNVLHDLVVATFRAGDRRGFEDLVGSGAWAELTADRQVLLESAGDLAHLLHNWDRDEELTVLLDRAADAAIDAGDYDRAARFRGYRTFWTRMPPREARALLDSLRGRLEPDTPGERVYLALQAQWDLLTAEPRTAVTELAARAVEGGKIFREHPDSPMPTVATYVLRSVDELDALELVLDRYVPVISGRGAWATVSAAWEQANLAFQRGEIARAEADAQTAVRVAREGGFLHAFPPWLGLLIEVLVERDEPATADAELSTSGLSLAHADSWWWGDFGVAVAHLRLAQGRPGDALDDMVTIARVLDESGVSPQYHSAYSLIALALAAAGEEDQALAVAEQEVAGARAWGLPRRIGIALRTLGLLTGGDRGLDLLRESLAVLEPTPARLEHTRTLAEYGAALRRANRRAEAREPLRTALEAARRAGALAVARRAYDELEATGEKLRPLLAGGVESLTPSERRVAELAADGQRNRDIAQTLFLSVKTVEGHLSNAYRKLDVHSRQELTAALSA